MKIMAIGLCLLVSSWALAQKTSIEFELNGRPSNKQLWGSVELSQNPFKKFIGEWTLKEDTWIQNWGSTTDTIKIPDHHTVSSQLNTDNSLLSIIDGPEPNGHIFWSYNPNTKVVSHLSSFGKIREGVGQGTFDNKGNLSLKIVFEGEPDNTYRNYSYDWVNDDSYKMRSVQFDDDNKPAGLFYEGTFTRVKLDTKVEKEREIFFDALRTENKKCLERIIDPEAVFMFEYQRALKGHEQIFEYFAMLFQEQETLEFKPITKEFIELHGYMIEIGTFSLDLQRVKVQYPFQHEGKYWCIWKKTTTGYKLYAYAQGYHNELPRNQYVVVDLGIQAEDNGNLELRAYSAYEEKAIKQWDPQMRIGMYTEDAIFYPFADSVKAGMETLKPYLKNYHQNDIKIDLINIRPFEFFYFEDHVLQFTTFEVDWRLNETSGTNIGKGMRLWKRQDENSLKIYRQISLHNHLKP